MEVCYWALLFMPLVILHHLLNVSVQLANKRGFNKKKTALLVLREEWFRNGALKRIFELQMEELIRYREQQILRNFVIRTVGKILL
jgi:hypothetical protein